MPHIGSQDPFFVSNNEDKLYFMRKPFTILLTLAAIAFTISSCDWLHGESDQSPEIYSSYFYVNPVFEGDSIISA